MSKLALSIYRIAFLLDSMHVPIIPTLINKIFLRVLLNCQIGLGAIIGQDVILGYGGLGTVIHHKAIVGNKVNIGTGVTIGGTTKKRGIPVIGDNCIISSGAKIIGPVEIGKNVVIGANAVVVTSIPENCVAVGVPARIIKTSINITDYRDF